MVSLGAVLEGFSDDVITYVTDPRTGIQRRSKWPPAISEVVEACEQREEQQRYTERLRNLPPIIPRLPSPRLKDMPEGYLAKVWVPDGNPRYAGLAKWAETADPVFWIYDKSEDGRPGIRVPWDIWNEGTR